MSEEITPKQPMQRAPGVQRKLDDFAARSTDRRSVLADSLDAAKERMLAAYDDHVAAASARIEEVSRG